MQEKRSRSSSPSSSLATWEGEFVRSRYSETLLDLLTSLQKDPQAVALYFETYPELPLDISQRGLVCLEHRLPALALKIFSFLLEYREEPLFHAACADSFMLAQRFEEAKSSYERVIALAPAIPDAYLGLAEAFMILKQPHEAIRVLGQLQALPSYPSSSLVEAAEKLLFHAKQAAQDGQDGQDGQAKQVPQDAKNGQATGGGGANGFF